MRSYKIEFYLYCDWEHFAPTYRVYFDDELMTERTYIWHNDRHVLRECLSVNADPDIGHVIKVEQVGQQTGAFCIEGIETDPPQLSVIPVLA